LKGKAKQGKITPQKPKMARHYTLLRLLEVLGHSSLLTKSTWATGNEFLEANGDPAGTSSNLPGSFWWKGMRQECRHHQDGTYRGSMARSKAQAVETDTPGLPFCLKLIQEMFEVT
jgi:hypothetical protein